MNVLIDLDLTDQAATMSNSGNLYKSKMATGQILKKIL